MGPGGWFPAGRRSRRAGHRSGREAARFFHRSGTFTQSGHLGFQRPAARGCFANLTHPTRLITTLHAMHFLPGIEHCKPLRALRAEHIALALSLLAVLVTYLITERIFEGIPHMEDEIAYVWQAEAIAGGKLTVPSPVDPKSFLVPFVVDFQGQRFGKYPLGWPVLLAIGVRFGVRSLVNPLLAGLGVWLAYRLGKKIWGETVGLLAAGLTITSPFFLMNSGSLLSHPFGLVLSVIFALAWLDAFGGSPAAGGVSRRRWIPMLAASLSLGALILTRPLTAVGVAFPFALHGLYLFIRK